MGLKILGYLMVATPFIGVTVFSIKEIGLKETILVWVGVFAACALIGAGVNIING